MQLKAGTRLKSAVCGTEVIVVKAPAGDVDVRCGGHPMIDIGAEAQGGTINPTFGEGTQLGKRYADDDIGVEILCTKAGEGSLSIGETVLPIKGAKPLPSSD